MVLKDNVIDGVEVALKKPEPCYFQRLSRHDVFDASSSFSRLLSLSSRLAWRTGFQTRLLQSKVISFPAFSARLILKICDSADCAYFSLWCSFSVPALSTRAYFPANHFGEGELCRWVLLFTGDEVPKRQSAAKFAISYLYLSCGARSRTFVTQWNENVLVQPGRKPTLLRQAKQIWPNVVEDAFPKATRQ